VRICGRPAAERTEHDGLRPGERPAMRKGEGR
jgi:hypothetical protein